MKNILCICGNGMGTSTILKINIKKICSENNIEANVESCAFSEAMSYLPMTDIIITSPEWADMIPKGTVKIVTVKNLIDSKQVKEALLGSMK